MPFMAFTVYYKLLKKNLDPSCFLWVFLYIVNCSSADLCRDCLALVDVCALCFLL